MDATLVTGWEGLCQVLGSAFTRPTFSTFLHIATRWVLCRSKPTVTNFVCTIGTSLLRHTAKHWTVYERFFYRATWSLQDVTRLLLVRIVAPLVKAYATEAVIDLAIDDTTCGRCGKHVAYAGYFKDASVSNTLKTAVHWGHNWVIGLPVLLALYRKRPDCDQRQVHPTKGTRGVWLAAGQGSSVISRHAGHPAPGSVGPSNKHKLDPQGPSARIMEHAAIHALRGSIKWLNRTKSKKALIRTNT